MLRKAEMTTDFTDATDRKQIKTAKPGPIHSTGLVEEPRDTSACFASFRVFRGHKFSLPSIGEIREIRGQNRSRSFAPLLWQNSVLSARLFKSHVRLRLRALATLRYSRFPPSLFSAELSVLTYWVFRHTMGLKREPRLPFPFRPARPILPPNIPWQFYEPP